MIADTLLALAGIVSVNLLLSGDNALVIALASRNLSPKQQNLAVFWGSAGAVALRIIFAFLAVSLLKIPYLQIIGALALEWIAVNLLHSKRQTEKIAAQHNLWAAVKSIIAADVVMSIDNVIALTAAAKGNMTLLVLGIVISIPIIVRGSVFIRSLMERWPVIIIAGAVFLGWTAGGMFMADIALAGKIALYPWSEWAAPSVFALVPLAFWQASKGRV